MAGAEALRLLAAQIEIPPMTRAEQRDAHLARTTALVSDALARRPADLVVLPELSSIAYSRPAFERLSELAEAIDGPSFRAWSGVARAHGVHVAFGFARRAGERFFISTGVVGPEGNLVGVYDKLHLCQYGASMEKEFFSRGEAVLTFEVNGLTCAPIICYDIRMPELARCLTLRHGVDLILHCGAYFRDQSFATWHAFITARALENQVFLLSLNRAGEDFGGSAFCRPWMDESRPVERFDAHREELRWFDVTRAEIDAARRDYTFLADRLPDYEDLPSTAQDSPGVGGVTEMRLRAPAQPAKGRVIACREKSLIASPGRGNPVAEVSRGERLLRATGNGGTSQSGSRGGRTCWAMPAKSR